MPNVTKSPTTPLLDGATESLDGPTGWIPSGTPGHPTAAPLDPADDGEIFEDISTPWVPVILSPSVGWPTAGAAVAAGLAAWALNAHRGAITASLCSLLAAALVVLAVIDTRTLRLPDSIVLPLIGVMGVGVVIAAIVGEIPGETALMAFECLGGAWALYWLLALVSGGLGYGDVKLSGAIGLGCGLAGYLPAGMGVALLPFALGGMVSMVLIVIGKRNLAIPFGPFMTAGGLIMLMTPGALGIAGA